MTSAISIFRIFRNKKLIIFRIFRELFVRFVRSKNFHETAWVAAIFLVRKSSKFEPSSRFFGRLKIFDFRDAHYLLHALTIENCDYSNSARNKFQIRPPAKLRTCTDLFCACIRWLIGKDI